MTVGIIDTVPFGHLLRAKRVEKRIGLRRFAQLVGVSPTYLSQVEQCNVAPPTVERVKRMAELLDQNPDAWIALAGRVPEDLVEVVHSAPHEMAQLLRTIRGMTPEQIGKVQQLAERLKEEMR